MAGVKAASNVLPFQAKQPRKSKKEYDLFKQARKEELGDGYPPESNRFNQCWTVHDHLHDIKMRYGKAALKFNLGLERSVFISPAYRALSANARMLYTMCWNETQWENREYNRREGPRKIKAKGKPCTFYLPYNRCMALGFSSDRAISRAFKELISFQFIEKVNNPGRGEANIYKHVYGHKEITEDKAEAIKGLLKEGRKKP
jgi:hypothetical protein